MKKLIFLGLIIFVTTGSYSQGKKYPLEGAWKCVYMGGPVTVDTSFKAIIKEGQIKMFSKEYFTFVGHYERNDTVYYEGYGAGTYTLNGDKYEEHIIYHNDKSLIGSKYKAFDRIQNDTLYHIVANDNWAGENKNYGIEKYVRLK
jgi:hypothetical protein